MNDKIYVTENVVSIDDNVKTIELILLTSSATEAEQSKILNSILDIVVKYLDKIIDIQKHNLELNDKIIHIMDNINNKADIYLKVLPLHYYYVVM